MCTLIAFYKMVPNYAVVVGMNRDEVYERPSSPPQTIHARTKIIAPRDNKAGGTWIGMNEKGLVVALANRQVTERSPELRSRGLLVLEALGQDNAAHVAEWLEADLEAHQYNPFNLFCADRKTIAFHLYEDGLETVEGVDGVNVLVNAGPNLDDEVTAAVRAMVHPSHVRDSKAATEALKRVCTCHPEESEAGEICKHGEKHGTVSSSIVAVNDASPWASHFLYADGCPCHNVYRSYSHQLRGWFEG